MSQAPCMKCLPRRYDGYAGPLPEAEWCLGCREECDRILWKWFRAREWGDPVRLNQAFLLGLPSGTTYNTSRLDEKAEPEIRQLVRLHDYGLVAVRSPSEGSGVRVRKEVGVSLDYAQRAFLEFLVTPSHGLIPIEKVKGLLNAILSHRDIKAITYSVLHRYPRPDDLAGNDPRNAVPILELHGFGQDVLYWSRSTWKEKGEKKPTLRGCAEAEAEVAEWRAHTGQDVGSLEHLPRVFPLNAVDGAGKRQWIPAVAKTWPINVSMWATEWNGGLDLQKIVEQLCQHVGLQARFLQNAVPGETLENEEE